MDKFDKRINCKDIKFQCLKNFLPDLLQKILKTKLIYENKDPSNSVFYSDKKYSSQIKPSKNFPHSEILKPDNNKSFIDYQKLNEV